jgi:hypothetical protein
MTRVRTRKAPPIDGKPSWWGEYLVGENWRKAASMYGPIRYTTAEDAERGAWVCLGAYAVPGGQGAGASAGG